MRVNRNKLVALCIPLHNTKSATCTNITATPFRYQHALMVARSNSPKVNTPHQENIYTPHSTFLICISRLGIFHPSSCGTNPLQHTSQRLISSDSHWVCDVSLIFFCCLDSTERESRRRWASIAIVYIPACGLVLGDCEFIRLIREERIPFVSCFKDRPHYTTHYAVWRLRIALRPSLSRSE